MKFSINQNVFEKFPNIVEYVAIFTGINNQPSDEIKSGILAQLRNVEEEVRGKFADQDLEKIDSIAPYLDIFQQFGVNPKKVKPSHLALLSRVIKGGNLPDINPYTNLYNAFSLKYQLPFGGEDLNEVYGNSELSLAQGGEHWLGIGEKEPKYAVAGELLWYDDYDVTCLDWNWRQCDRTKVTEKATASYMVVDGIEGKTDAVCKEALEEFAESVKIYLGGDYKIYRLDSKNNQAEIHHESKSRDGLEVPEKKVRDAKEESKAKSQKIQEQKAKELSYVYADDTIESKIQNALFVALNKCKIAIEKHQISVEKSADKSKGDYTSTVVLRVAKKYGRNPIELSKQVAQGIKSIESVVKVEAAAPGFINFFIDSKIQSNVLENIVNENEEFGSSKHLNQQTWLVEHTSPNPNKAMHLGHLRNNVTGMAVSNIIEASGINVIRGSVDNNRGIALAKLMWGYLKFGKKDGKQDATLAYWDRHRDEWLTPQEANTTPDKLMDKYYVLGATDFKENPEIEKTVRDFVVKWEAKDRIAWDLWKCVLDYAYEGQKLVLDRLNNRWDIVWHEHEHYQMGKDFVDRGIKEGIFVKDKGAIITQFSDYKMPNTVVIKADGTSLYITQDIALTYIKKTTLNAQRLFWVVGPEQSLALNQMFAVCEQLGIGKMADFTHLPYGYMSIKGQGKMASRSGNVLYIEDLLDEAKARILAHYEQFPNEKLSQTEKEEIAEKVGVGSVKYSILKVGRLTDVAFDFDTSFSFDGDSAPYIMYTYVRTCSVLRQAGINSEALEKLLDKAGDSDKYVPNDLELALVKKLADFPALVKKSAEQFAPNYVCLYLYQLAQQFSEFYNKMPIIKAESDAEKNYRLLLSACVGIVIKNGFALLGIETVDKM